MEGTEVRSTDAPRLGFRPDIAGLRAVAVGLVVVLHAGVTSVSGGYVGVDVFFVISGFLITSLLIDETRATGRVSILGFYARRARRILPAACFVIAVTVVAAYLQLGPLIGRTTAIDGKWAAAFAANFRFIQQGTDYFASAQPPSPLQHYWSLAVEEQFYLVWPTLLFGLVLLGRRAGRSNAARSNLVLQLGIVAVVVGSLFWSVHESAIDRTTAYFSPFTRAWELGAGALIAVFSVAIASTPAVLRAIATWVGLVCIGIAAFTFTAATVFPGYAALLPVMGTVLIIAGGIGTPRGSAGTMLGFKPLQWLGLISFSIYLWHWPVLTIAEERSGEPLSNVARVVCVVIIFGLSVASYYAIERPLHTTGVLKAKNPQNAWERSRRALVAGAAVIAVAVAVSALTNNRAVDAIDRASGGAAADQELAQGLPAAATPAEKAAQLEQTVERLVQQGLALDHVPDDVQPPVLALADSLDADAVNCMQKDRAATQVKTCTFGTPKARETIVMFGDSHAMQWMPALDLYGRHAGYRVVTVYKAECPVPSLDLFIAPPNQLGGPRVPFPQCATWREAALRYIRSLKPTAVVMAFSAANTTLTGRGEIPPWTDGLAKSIHALQDAGARVIEIGNNPYLPEDPGLCLSRPNADPTACIGKYLDRPRYDAELATVRAAGGTAIDISPWFCVDDRCPVIIGKRIAYSNNGHLTARYVSDLEPLLAASFRTAGLR